MTQRVDDMSQMKHGHKLAGCQAEHPEIARLRVENERLRGHVDDLSRNLAGCTAALEQATDAQWERSDSLAAALNPDD